MSQGGWIFISHSHQDIAMVRKIRNHFEKLGFEPLMFYLKCLSDENEIEALIKREIDEREWFIYADSPNARLSKWVKTERDYIERSEGKRIFVINLQDDLEKQCKEIEHVARQMKVFISYARQDKGLYLQIREKLLARDMRILSDEDILAGSRWDTAIADQVSAACRDGFVLLLITQHSAQSRVVEMEIAQAKREKGKIIPVYIGGSSVSPALMNMMGGIQGVRMSETPTEQELDKLVDDILRRVEYYSSEFQDTYGFRNATTIQLPPIARIDSMTFWDCPNLRCVTVPETVVYITPDAFDDHRDILIKCHANTYCHWYCQKNGFRYELLDTKAD